MSFEDRSDFSRQVADLNKYGQALNQAQSVEEVASLTVEALSILMDFPYATFVEVSPDGTLRVVQSTYPPLAPGDEPDEPARQAVERGETTTVTGEAAGIDDSDVVAALAVPGQVVDEIPAVIVTRSTELESFEEEHVRPLEILASHAVTAISNIRSHERLERARQDLARRKEMIEMYDRLLRHDLRNDLQVIQGYSDLLSAKIDDEDMAEYADRVQHATDTSLDLIERIGDLVKTLEEQDEPEPLSLREAVESAIESVEPQFESLTVEYDPEDFEFEVYGDDLLESAVSNLVSNAAVHNDGPITVRCYVEAPDPGHVVVGVADDGAGIPSEIRDELFEIGVKGPESEGTGFGLGFVNALIESYGGELTVAESDRGGADFQFTLERVR